MIERALDEYLTPEQMGVLIDRVLAIDKTAYGYCPSCQSTRIRVVIPDSKAVVSALTELLVQAKGRPGQAEMNPEERQLVFVNEIVLAGSGANGS